MDFKMTENQIKEAIIRMNNSEEYLALKKYYDQESFLKILHVSRDEKVHSNFIHWILNPNSHHELDYFPLQKFLEMISIIYSRADKEKVSFPDGFEEKFLLGDYTLTDESDVCTEFPTNEIAGFDNKGRIDILITLAFKGSDKILPIIIENKVLSTENDENRKSKKADKSKQTEKYFEWAKEKYKDETKYEKPILIFLAPDFESEIKCKSEAFIKVSYQNLVDYVIEPCLMRTANDQSKFFIENYLRCLSNTTINKITGKKEGRIMAFISKERELLEKFHEKNKELLEAVLMMLKNDENLSDEEREGINSALKVSGEHDYSKYLFNGNEYRKGRLILAVVQYYKEDKNPKDFDDLQSAFPANLRGGDGVIKKLNEVSDEDKGLVPGKQKRYYVDENEIIELPSGEKVVVSNQWGGVEKINNFIEHVKQYGYSITKLN